jgi:hypothetical protein
VIVRWQPLAVIAAGTVSVAAFMLLSGMGPELVLVVSLGLLVGLGGWQLATLADATPTESTGTISERGAPPARADRRVMRLRAGLAYGRPDGITLERLRATLVDVIDDQLLTAHQIDRAADPVAAAAVLGPELQHFVDDPDASALTQPDRLEHTLTLIERL